MVSLDSPDRVIDHHPINRGVGIAPTSRELTNRELEDDTLHVGTGRWSFEKKKRLFHDRENPPIAEEKEIGRKFDQDKTDWSLLPWAEVEKIVKVLMFGSRKYDRENWKKVKNAKIRYFAAAIRHLVAWFSGEKLDSESNLSHLSHAGCCILFLLWADDNVED